MSLNRIGQVVEGRPVHFTHFFYWICKTSLTFSYVDLDGVMHLVMLVNCVFSQFNLIGKGKGSTSKYSQNFLKFLKLKLVFSLENGTHY